MKIPYGRSHFGDIRRGGFFYVDKTPFIPRLESAELGYAYLVLLRPRRMGKSLSPAPTSSWPSIRSSGRGRTSQGSLASGIARRCSRCSSSTTMATGSRPT